MTLTWSVCCITRTGGMEVRACSWPGCCLLLMLVSTAIAKQCLDGVPLSQYPRHLFYDGKSVPIRLETSKRATHNITNHILKILLEEVIGYESVEIVPKDSMNATAILNRLSGCPPSGCVEGDPEVCPETMVNTEVWMTAGFTNSPWVSPGHIINLGPLGPFGRLGWFMPSSAVDKLWKDNIIADHWRALNLQAVIRNFTLAEHFDEIRIKTRTDDPKNKYYCSSPDCVDGIYYGPKCSPTNMYTCATLLASYPDMDLGVLKAQVRSLNLPVNIAWIGPHLDEFVLARIDKQQPVLFFSWDPNRLTAEKLFTRIKFPLCQNDLTNLPTECDFGLSQFNKVVWSKVKTSIPEAYHLISKMTFHQQQYIQLLQMFRTYSHAEDIACDWVRSEKKVWEEWLPQNLSNKTKIYLGGLFPLTGHYWVEPGLVQGAELALDLINKDSRTLPEHHLEMIVSNSECLPDISMKAFIKYITNASIPLAGILGPGCSDEAEPIAALSRHFNMLAISYGAEASVLSDRQKYPFFYRTIPQVEHNKFVYESFFKTMDWNQVGAVSEGNQEFPDYHLLLQEHLHHSGISVVVKRKLVRTYNLNQLDVSQIFADLRNQNVRVIIADFFVFSARAVMCEAWRQRMTAHEGYVWFLPSWFSKEWWDVDFYNSPPSPGDNRPQESIPCTTANMEYAVEGHFMLQKTFSDPDSTKVIGNITIGEYKELYARRVGHADLDGTPFASYVYDAVWVYAKALDGLLKKHPGVLENFHSAENTQQFVQEINNTSFQGVSGHIHFNGGDRPGTISIVQYFLNETRLIGRYEPGTSGNKGSLDIYHTKLRWLTPGGVKPSDGNPERDDCSLESIRQMFHVSCEIAIVIVNVFGFGLLIIILVIILIVVKFKYDKKVKATHQRMRELGLLNNDFAQCFSLDDWEIPREKLVLNRKLGEGAFGTVYGGEAQIDEEGWVAVAVKTLKVGSTVQEKVDFLSEAELMKSFSHNNIVCLLGVCTRAEPVYAIMEFLLHGDLKTYLLSRRNLIGSFAKEAEDVSPHKLTHMALDVAYGLRYLHDLKFVHRDLACRNCLVHCNGTVKIGDFGMTRRTCDTDYYRFNKKGILPVRWMSPESLSDGFFTSKSDIWSYGILIYEIVTFGSFPYQGLSNSQVLEYVKNGGRINVPRNCPMDLCNLIYNCLESEMSNRCDIEDIIDDLMKKPELLIPCLNAPTTSVAIEDTDNAFEIPPSSCQNTISQSQAAKFTALVNRRSFYGSSSQEKLNSVKRLSGTPGNVKYSPSKPPNIKTFMQVSDGRPRSNSVDSPQESLLGDRSKNSHAHKDRTKRNSEDILHSSSYSKYMPQISKGYYYIDTSADGSGNQGNRTIRLSGDTSQSSTSSSNNKYIPLLSKLYYSAEPSSDYYSDTSKELCQTITSL